MKTTYKVSVIVPVYNAEPYLRESLGSILNQTLRDIQIIFIDDGSTDDSFNILKEFAEKDTRIEIFIQNHAGAANARNSGINYATGNYLCFLDSDDIFEANMLEELYRSAVNEDADVVICEHDTCLSENSSPYLENVIRKYMSKYCQNPFRINEMPAEGLICWSPVPWNKLYRKSFLEKNQIFFQNLKSANDVYFSTMSLILADRIIHTQSFKAMIHHRTNIEGQISSYRSVRDEYRAFEKIYSDLTKKNLIVSIYKQYFVQVFFHIFYGLLRSKDSHYENKQFYEFFAEKGMQELGLLEGENVHGLFGYRKFLNYFKNNSYDSQWYRDDKTIVFQLENKGLNEIRKLCKENRVAIWGAGAKGKAVVDELEKVGIKLAGIIDSDKQKKGTVMYDYEIKPYNLLREDVDIIILTSKVVFNSICMSICRDKDFKVKILPLFMYLESNNEISNCIFELNDLRQILIY